MSGMDTTVSIALGIYALYFVFSRLEQTKGYLLIYVVGLASLFGGVALIPGSPGPA